MSHVCITGFNLAGKDQFEGFISLHRVNTVTDGIRNELKLTSGVGWERLAREEGLVGRGWRGTRIKTIV